ncbi:MAG: YfiR family protein [Pseudomonadota bacterium]
MHRPLAGLFLVALAWTGLAYPRWSEAQLPAPEPEVKAAFVYNFIRFAEWPASAFPSPGAPIQLCLLGSTDPLLDALANIDGKSARGRPVRVQSLSKLKDAGACQVLVVGESEKRKMHVALASAAASATLTVSEIDGFAEAGGMIGLVRDIDRIQFEVNLQSAQQAGLQLSSQLLKLARRVIR